MSVDIPAHIKAKRMASWAVTTQIDGVTYNVWNLLGDPTRPLQKSRQEIFDRKNGWTEKVDNWVYGVRFWEAETPVAVLMKDEGFYQLDKKSLRNLLSLLLIMPNHLPNDNKTRSDSYKIIDIQSQVHGRIWQWIKETTLRELVSSVLRGVFWGKNSRDRLFDQWGNITDQTVESIWKMMNGDLVEIDKVWHNNAGWHLSGERKWNDIQELWYKVKERTSE